MPMDVVIYKQPIGTEVIIIILYKLTKYSLPLDHANPPQKI